MSLSSALARGRQSHTSRMTDTFSIGVPTGGFVYDPVTQTEVEAITPLFATLAEATTVPHAAVWRDVAGERVSLPRELSKNSVEEGCRNSGGFFDNRMRPSGS